jgi:PKD repeat protein
MRGRIFLLGLLALAVLTLATACPSSGPSPGPTNQSPVASFSCSQTSGQSPLAVTFDASASTDPDGWISQYNWDFGDGNVGSDVTTSHTYISTMGETFICTLTVTDNDGAEASAIEEIEVAPFVPEKECRVTVILEMIELDYNNHVGNEWSITARAVEHDKYSDFGSARQTFVISCTDTGIETEYGNLEVLVREDRGRYAGNTALWRFYIRVYVHSY